jgi:glycosyltransferase involved in cell wall biosynthesis
MMRRRPQEVSSELMPAHPKVSVAVATYNHEAFIAQAVESVLMQRTNFAYELIIGEDCSTDETRRIVMRYQQQHPDKIRLLLQPRNTRGLGNFEDVYEACRGDYVAELEGDDYWLDPQKLQLQVDMLDANPAAFICGARAYVWTEGASAPSAITPHEDAPTLSSYGARELFDGKWWFRTCTKVYPRGLFQSIPPRFHCDWAATMWLIARTGFAPVCFLDRVVAVYREHSGGVWSAAPQHSRVVSDVSTLFKLIPLFEGESRAFLKELLRDRIHEILTLEDAPRFSGMTSACRGALRSPEDPLAWRHLAASIRVAARRTSQRQ